MSLDKATTGLPMPLHPGAARYFKEAGLGLPDQSLAGRRTITHTQVSANTPD